LQVWDWAGQARPLRIHRAQGGDPCLLYHARLWGRALGELRVAAGTAFNQVLVWSPGQANNLVLEGVRRKGGEGYGTVGQGDGKPGDPEEVPPCLPRGGVDVLRLKGHEGVIFRVAWSEDGMRLASASDDRTVRVWDVER
ncbi:unnamed protein product, partial [Ectocarpus sp. 8 AP-2014]